MTRLTGTSTSTSTQIQAFIHVLLKYPFTAYVHRFNVEISDESYQVSWLDLVAEEEEKNEAKAKKDFKGSKAMMGGSIDPYASDDDDQLKVSFDKLLFLVHLIYMS